MDDALRRELLALAAEDERVRAELAADGSLFGGYHPRMEDVHRRNAARLREIIAGRGWPGEALVGRDGAQAAWLVVQHAIGEPAFLRQCLALLQAAATRGDAPAWQPAMLEDRIRLFEGRPQRYGTQIEHDDGGRPRPWLIEDPDGVDDRRRTVGLEPLAERLAREPHEPPPADPVAFRLGYADWLERTGWRPAVVRYRADLRDAFDSLNRRWIEALFTIEPRDEAVLRDPEGEIIARGGEIFFVLDRGGVPVGTCALLPTGAGAWYLTKMAVDPAAQGRGYSHALLRAAIEHAQSRGAARVTLTSNRQLGPALGLYRKHGFREVPLEPGDRDYARVDIRMELAL